MAKLIIITWASWSWKTTLMNDLLEMDVWFERTIDFTTRPPREKEEHKYINISKDDLITKYIRWDLIWINTYSWALYAIWKYLYNWKWLIKDFDWTVLTILAPNHIPIVKDYAKDNWIIVKVIKLTIDGDTMMDRMMSRWDNLNTISDRLSNFEYHNNVDADYEIDWWDNHILVSNKARRKICETSKGI